MSKSNDHAVSTCSPFDFKGHSEPGAFASPNLEAHSCSRIQIGPHGLSDPGCPWPWPRYRRVIALAS